MKRACHTNNKRAGVLLTLTALEGRRGGTAIISENVPSLSLRYRRKEGSQTPLEGGTRCSYLRRGFAGCT